MSLAWGSFGTDKIRQKEKMGSTNTKEEIIVAQPGAGNSASARQATTLSLSIYEFLGIIVGVVLLIILIIYLCKRCGKKVEGRLDDRIHSKVVSLMPV